MKPKEFIENGIENIDNRLLVLNEQYFELLTLRNSLRRSKEPDDIQFLKNYSDELNVNIKELMDDIIRKKNERMEWLKYKEDPRLSYDKIGVSHKIYEPNDDERKIDERFRKRMINDNKSEDARLRR